VVFVESGEFQPIFWNLVWVTFSHLTVGSIRLLAFVCVGNNDFCKQGAPACSGAVWPEFFYGKWQFFPKITKYFLEKFSLLKIIEIITKKSVFTDILKSFCEFFSYKSWRPKLATLASDQLAKPIRKNLNEIQFSNQKSHPLLRPQSFARNRCYKHTKMVYN
jgi:hypothetical protein